MRELEGRVGYLMARVRHIAQDEGFAVNEAKSRVLRRNAAQVVTGLVVNAGRGWRGRRCAGCGRSCTVRGRKDWSGRTAKGGRTLLPGCAGRSRLWRWRGRKLGRCWWVSLRQCWGDRARRGMRWACAGAKAAEPRDGGFSLPNLISS